jgi:Cu2+-exporting ATPase
MNICLHCGGPLPGAASPADEGYCCAGCRAAHALVTGLGLNEYYRRRTLDPSQRLLKPEEADAPLDFEHHVRPTGQGRQSLHLMVEGLHCAACVWLIETVLGREPGVEKARLNMTTRRLELVWREGEANASQLAAKIAALGYRLVPFDPEKLADATSRHEKDLLKAMAVAGFAASNVMLLSVSVWAGHFATMGFATRAFLHWVSALIVLPAVVYAGQPFFQSAWSALKSRRTNMDVPISLGVTLACLMSLWETMKGGEHAYFDSAITLLFFLLIGRYLDSRARGRARSAAEHLLALGAKAVTVIEADGTRRHLPPGQAALGALVLVAAGERIGIDGRVVEGVSDLDQSLISGETMPKPARPGTCVFAGTLNLSAPLRIEVTATGGQTLLAEIVRLMEVAEAGRARFTALADRVARYYAPVVHVAALSTFLVWTFLLDLAWQKALLNAVAVLIITCPCALALAVPVVQVIACGRLLRQGILMKSATALERLAEIDTVVFDKTGTLTLGRAELQAGDWQAEDLALAAGLAANSRHPLSRALARAAPAALALQGVEEMAGQGLRQGDIKLGSRDFCGVGASAAEGQGPELWLARPGVAPIRFAFADSLRPDAKLVVEALKAKGLAVELLSGDRTGPVDTLARETGIDSWRAGCRPAEKVQALEELRANGRRVMMVGDGLNDAPALAAAHVSLSPSSAADVSQNAADAVFQGDRLFPVLECLEVARRSGLLVRQNFMLAILYNLVTVPLAMAGQVTPLIAAVAMSTSSLLVIGNALRLGRGRSQPA